MAIGIPDHMVRWIQACLSPATFSIALNGELHGFFPSTKGIQQGDPLSPYLFILVMEGCEALLGRPLMISGFGFTRDVNRTLSPIFVLLISLYYFIMLICTRWAFCEELQIPMLGFVD